MYLHRLGASGNGNNMSFLLSGIPSLMSTRGRYVSSGVQPKPGFGIGNGNQIPISVSVSELNFFFQKLKLSVSNFSHVFHFFLGSMSF